MFFTGSESVYLCEIISEAMSKVILVMYNLAETLLMSTQLYQTKKVLKYLTSLKKKVS